MSVKKKAESSTSVSSHPFVVDKLAGLRVLMRNFGDENLASEPFIYMPSMVNDGSETDVSVQEQELTMFVLPGVEGCAAEMAPLCRRLKIKTCVLQYGLEKKRDTLDALVYRLHKTIKSKLAPGSPYILLGYSFGTLPMLILASMLESEGHNGKLFCLDGSPEFLYSMVTTKLSTTSDTQLQNSIICHCLNMVSPKNDISSTLIEKLEEIESFEEKIKYALTTSPDQLKYSDKFLKSMAYSSFDRFKMILSQNKLMKIKAPIVLMRPDVNTQFLMIEKNYGLGKYTEGPVTVHIVEGNHVSIIDNNDCANIINRVLAGQDEGKPGLNHETTMVDK